MKILIMVRIAFVNVRITNALCTGTSFLYVKYMSTGDKQNKVPEKALTNFTLPEA